MAILLPAISLPTVTFFRPISTRRQRVSCILFALFVNGLPVAVAQVNPPIPAPLSPPVTPPTATTATPFDTLRWQAEDETRKTQDPELKRVPYERLDDARAQLATRQQSGNKTGIAGVTWQERGPTNAGGVTRAVLFDLSDPTRKKAWAGSVGGGLWYTNDITNADSSWYPVSDSWENLNISALAADPSNLQVMYAGTGDGFGSYSAPNGGGIWKTINGGSTWTRLAGTIPASAGTPLQIGFGSIMKLVVSTSGVVFAATRYGVVRSADGGSSWQFVLAPQQAVGGVPPLTTSGAGYIDDFTTDLEIGSDNTVYAGFRNGRVFRATSTAGMTWTEITPPNTAPYNGTRVELALAPSTNGSGQVVYAIATFTNTSNYSRDIKWFSKSINGGDAWTTVTELLYPYNTSPTYFTQGTGYYTLVLAVAPDNANTVYAGGYSGYWYRSVDGGQAWSSAYYTNGSAYQLTFGAGKAVVWGSENSPNYLADFPALFTNQYVPYARPTNYRTAKVSAVAQRNAVNSSFAWLNAEVYGPGSINTAGPSLLTRVGYGQAIPYLDQDQSTIGLTYIGNQDVYIYDVPGGTSVYKAFPYYTNYNFASDYDSQNNVFYAYQNGLQKIVGVGTTNQAVSLNTYISGTPTCIKAGKAPNTVFIAGSTGLLYKVTNTNQATPTLVRIDNDALPTTATINCIEVGADDNELLLVLSNYGVRSVWYTTNGGQNWVSKDEVAHGLPDMPVRWALFNPANRKQVMLATELGIWSTTDITAANSGWQPTLTGMPVMRCNMLRHRTADGRVVVATQGRGVWETNVWATAYTLPTISIASLSSTSLCINGTVSVSVAVTNGAVSSSNFYTMYLSDATGSFANPYTLAIGTTASLTATVPTYINNVVLPYSTNYRLKVVASDPEVETAPSSPITIGTITNVGVVFRELPNYGGFSICPGTAVDLIANFSGQRDFSGQYEWQFNGTVVANATSATLTTTQPGTYQLTFRQGGCQAVGSNSFSNTTAIYGNPAVANGASVPGPQCDGQRTRMVSTYVGKSAVYQWFKDGVAIPGATQYGYEATQTGTYSFTVRDGACQNAASLGGTSLQFGQNLAATLQVNGAMVCPGYLTYMYLREGNPANYTYQWQANGSDITGANQYYYFGSAGNIYTVKVTQGSCRAISNPVEIQVGTPTVTLNNLGKKQLCTGDVRTISASGLLNYSSTYQWQKSGVDIPGAISSTYSVTATGIYRVRVAAGSCAATSPEVTYQVGNVFTPDIFRSATEWCSGNANSILLNTYTIAQYTYQWSRDGVDIPGATQDFYNASRGGTYGLRTTGSSCSGTAYVSIRRDGLPKPIVSIIGPPQRCSGSAVQLSGSYYNAGGASYQWKRNGAAIPGATNFYQLYATESGLYTLTMKQATCEVESDPIDVKIGEPTAAALSGDAFITAGQPAQLPLTFTGPGPWSFMLSNGQSVQNIATNPYFVSVTPATTTIYSVSTITGSCGTGTVAGSAQVRVGAGSADVSLAIQVSNRTPAVNDLLSYSLILTNAGPQTAQYVQVTNVLPAGLEFVDSPAIGNVQAANGIVTVGAGLLAVGTSVAYSFRARATLPGVFINAAQITDATTPDPDSQPGSGTGDGQDDAAQVDFRTKESSDRIMVSTNANQTPLPVLLPNQPVADPNTADLSLATVVDSRSPNVANGDVVTATLTVRNQGGASASNVSVQIVLPNGLFDYQNAPGWTPVTENRIYTGFINLIPAGGEAKLTIRWQPSGNGVLKAQILSMYETDPDSTPGNGTGKGEDDEALADVRAR